MVLKNLLGGLKNRPPAQPEFDAPLAPDAPLYVIGDIHGRLDLLRAMFRKIVSIEPNPRVVLVGDYIDRGEASAGVLWYLRDLTKTLKGRVICLKGNHEEMCLKFLHDPEKYGDRWFKYGGLQTLDSYGINQSTKRDSKSQIRYELALAMGGETIDWLDQLPTSYSSGNVLVTHAGANPNRGVDDQSTRDLIWGHPDFPNVIRNDDHWVVFGHQIFREASATDGRIAVDTGAYSTGRLSAACIKPGELSFLTVEA